MSEKSNKRFKNWMDKYSIEFDVDQKAYQHEYLMQHDAMMEQVDEISFQISRNKDVPIQCRQASINTLVHRNEILHKRKESEVIAEEIRNYKPLVSFKIEKLESKTIKQIETSQPTLNELDFEIEE